MPPRGSAASCSASGARPRNSPKPVGTSQGAEGGTQKYTGAPIYRSRYTDALLRKPGLARWVYATHRALVSLGRRPNFIYLNLVRKVGSRVWGLGFWVWGLGGELSDRVQKGLRFGVWGVGFWVRGLGLRV